MKKQIRIKHEVEVLTAVVVSLAFLLHFYRVVTQKALTLGTWVVPMWLSYLAVIVTLTIIYFHWKAILGK